MQLGIPFFFSLSLSKNQSLFQGQICNFFHFRLLQTHHTRSINASAESPFTRFTLSLNSLFGVTILSSYYIVQLLLSGTFHPYAGIFPRASNHPGPICFIKPKASIKHQKCLHQPASHLYKCRQFPHRGFGSQQREKKLQSNKQEQRRSLGALQSSRHLKFAKFLLGQHKFTQISWLC